MKTYLGPSTHYCFICSLTADTAIPSLLAVDFMAFMSGRCNRRILGQTAVDLMDIEQHRIFCGKFTFTDIQCVVAENDKDSL